MKLAAASLLDLMAIVPGDCDSTMPGIKGLTDLMEL